MAEDINNDELEAIVEANLRLMCLHEDGGMKHLLRYESIGGNAGRNCLGASFYFESSSGRILYFKNASGESSDLRNGVFRLRISSPHSIIVSAYVKANNCFLVPIAKSGLEPKALKALELTVERYNSGKRY
ncbi:hypothetical protein KY316_01845 [Candidatus Woesearchaeota archaeon]|nr:hypothetical protein [Candidatus Woesearchaeota archaeon]